jgi:hypothetical protein
MIHKRSGSRGRGFCSLSLMISTSTTMIKEIRRKDKIKKKN